MIATTPTTLRADPQLLSYFLQSLAGTELADWLRDIGQDARGHVGDPQGHGVGIEVKMPKNNSDVQRALGQLDQYQRRYGENLLLFVLLDFLKPETAHFMQEELKRKTVRSVWR